jgi:hypothetical protein
MNRYLAKLPYMRRWDEWRKRNATRVRYAVQVFQEMRSSGRTLRPRVVAMLDGTGIHHDDFLKSLADAKLLSVKRGRAGGVYYPSS